MVMPVYTSWWLELRENWRMKWFHPAANTAHPRPVLIHEPAPVGFHTRQTFVSLKSHWFWKAYWKPPAVCIIENSIAWGAEGVEIFAHKSRSKLFFELMFAVEAASSRSALKAAPPV